MTPNKVHLFKSVSNNACLVQISSFYVNISRSFTKHYYYIQLVQ
jgi:hypothetical protein